MIEEINSDNNCIVKAFENNPISILQEDIDNKKVYYFKASDIGKALDLSNIRVSIQNFDEDEHVVRKAYDTTNRQQDTIFLTSQGIYRLLYSSKKDIAKKFRKWAGAILDDIIFNESNELKKQIEEKDKLLKNREMELKNREIELENTKKELEKKTKLSVKKWYYQEPGHVIYGFKSNQDSNLITIGKSKNIKNRESVYLTHNQTGEMFYIRRCYNSDLAEKVLHHILDKYREENNKEWFSISEKLTIYVIDIVCDFLDMFINCSEKLPEFKIKEFFNDLPVEKYDTTIDVKKKGYLLIPNLDINNKYDDNETNQNQILYESLKKYRKTLENKCIFCNTIFKRKFSLIRHLKDSRCKIGENLTVFDFYNKLIESPFEYIV